MYCSSFALKHHYTFQMTNYIHLLRHMKNWCQLKMCNISFEKHENSQFEDHYFKIIFLSFSFRGFCFMVSLDVGDSLGSSLNSGSSHFPPSLDHTYQSGSSPEHDGYISTWKFYWNLKLNSYQTQAVFPSLLFLQSLAQCHGNETNSRPASWKHNIHPGLFCCLCQLPGLGGLTSWLQPVLSQTPFHHHTLCPHSFSFGSLIYSLHF